MTLLVSALGTIGSSTHASVGAISAVQLQHEHKLIIIYTMNHKNGGSTFVIITLENLDRFLKFCTVVSRKKCFIHTWQKCPPHLNNVLTLPSEN